MKRSFPSMLVAWAIVLFAVSTPAHDAQPALSAEQAARDVRVLVRALRALHPALTKYLSAAEIDAAFATFESRGQAARTPVQMYLAAAELAAAIRCGHTWANVRNQEGAVKAALFEAADKPPFLMTLVEGRWLVLASADPAVNAGDELLAMNGVQADALVRGLLPYVRADGRSDGKRLRQLSHDRGDHSPLDMLLPLLWPPQDGAWRLKLRSRQAAEREVVVRSVTLAARTQTLLAKGWAPPREAWSLQIDGDTAVLSMPTWSLWNRQAEGFAFIDAAFERLEKERARQLIIDLRANEGGDSAFGERILSHLTGQAISYPNRQVVSAYERVPYTLARYLDTWDFSFFDKTGQVVPIAEGTAAGKFALERERGTRTQIDPAEPRFKGAVYLLVSAENSSATFLFADWVQQFHLGTLVGQATGGNRRGLNGGQLAWVVLPNSGASVDIPLLASSYDEATPDMPVLPDVPVVQRFEARARDQDAEMDAVRALIKARASPPADESPR